MIKSVFLFGYLEFLYVFIVPEVVVSILLAKS